MPSHWDHVISLGNGSRTHKPGLCLAPTTWSYYVCLHHMLAFMSESVRLMEGSRDICWGRVGKQVNPVPLRWAAPRPQWGWKESSLRYPHGAAAINPALQSGRELGGESEAPETHLLKCYGTRCFVVYFTKYKSPCRMHSRRLVGGGERSHLGHCDNKDQWTGSLHDRGQKTGMGLLAHWAG